MGFEPPALVAGTASRELDPGGVSEKEGGIMAPERLAWTFACAPPRPAGHFSIYPDS
jgi:hypothetical protein